jgi:predicted phosphate transport protein (TIGR00153 family)
MDKSKLRLFHTTKEVETHFDSFLDTVSQGGMAFRSAVETYLDAAGNGDLKAKLDQLNDLEHKGDDLRRQVEHELYTLALIPDFRGDVLSLLEDLDSLLNVMEETMVSFEIERPAFPPELHADLRQLAENVSLAVESAVMASRAFLRDIQSVRDHLHKVMFYEKEADRASDKLKRAVFASSLPLAEKLHLRRFVDQIDHIADESEDVADWLAIYTIKRLD